MKNDGKDENNNEISTEDNRGQEHLLPEEKNIENENKGTAATNPNLEGQKEGEGLEGEEDINEKLIDPVETHRVVPSNDPSLSTADLQSSQKENNNTLTSPNPSSKKREEDGGAVPIGESRSKSEIIPNNLQPQVQLSSIQPSGQGDGNNHEGEGVPRHDQTFPASNNQNDPLDAQKFINGSGRGESITQANLKNKKEQTITVDPQGNNDLTISLNPNSLSQGLDNSKKQVRNNPPVQQSNNDKTNLQQRKESAPQNRREEDERQYYRPPQQPQAQEEPIDWKKTVGLLVAMIICLSMLAPGIGTQIGFAIAATVIAKGVLKETKMDKTIGKMFGFGGGDDGNREKSTRKERTLERKLSLLKKEYGELGTEAKTMKEEYKTRMNEVLKNTEDLTKHSEKIQKELTSVKETNKEMQQKLGEVKKESEDMQQELTKEKERSRAQEELLLKSEKLRKVKKEKRQVKKGVLESGNWVNNEAKKEELKITLVSEAMKHKPENMERSSIEAAVDKAVENAAKTSVTAEGMKVPEQKRGKTVDILMSIDSSTDYVKSSLSVELGKLTDFPKDGIKEVQQSATDYGEKSKGGLQEMKKLSQKLKASLTEAEKRVSDISENISNKKKSLQR